MGTASRLVAMSRVPEVLRGSRTRVGQGRAGRHAPRLWPVPLAAAAAVLVAGAVAGLIYSFLRSNAVPVEVPGSGPAVDVLEVVKTTIAATAFVGAILAGLYAYRKRALRRATRVAPTRRNSRRGIPLPPINSDTRGLPPVSRGSTRWRT
jgi:hypothetical protein